MKKVRFFINVSLLCLLSMTTLFSEIVIIQNGPTVLKIYSQEELPGENKGNSYYIAVGGKEISGHTIQLLRRRPDDPPSYINPDPFHLPPGICSAHFTYSGGVQMNAEVEDPAIRIIRHSDSSATAIWESVNENFAGTTCDQTLSWQCNVKYPGAVIYDDISINPDGIITFTRKYYNYDARFQPAFFQQPGTGEPTYLNTLPNNNYFPTHWLHEGSDGISRGVLRENPINRSGTDRFLNFLVIQPWGSLPATGIYTNNFPCNTGPFSRNYFMFIQNDGILPRWIGIRDNDPSNIRGYLSVHGNISPEGQAAFYAKAEGDTPPPTPAFPGYGALFHRAINNLETVQLTSHIVPINGNITTAVSQANARSDFPNLTSPDCTSLGLGQQVFRYRKGDPSADTDYYYYSRRSDDSGVPAGFILDGSPTVPKFRIGSDLCASYNATVTLYLNSVVGGTADTFGLSGFRPVNPTTNVHTAKDFLGFMAPLGGPVGQPFPCALYYLSKPGGRFFHTADRVERDLYVTSLDFHAGQFR